MEQARDRSELAGRFARLSYSIGVIFWAVLAFMVMFTLFYLFFYYVVDAKLH